MRTLPAFLAFVLLQAQALAGETPATRIAAGGQPVLPVVVAKDASARVRQGARTLADYLGKMSGGTFAVKDGDGRVGLAVGRFDDFPNLASQVPAATKEPTASEDYLLRSHAGGLYLLGRSDQAVEHAVWDFLYRLGYRQFFPGPTWEVMPKKADLQLAVDVLEKPSYFSRRIWYGYGTWDYNDKAYPDWCAKNRATGGIVLRTGHAYDGIHARNKKEFEAHPEYLGLFKGERRTKQYCISNPGLRKLVVEDALTQMKRDPAAQSISLEPADGGGWCECEHCRKLGSVSDRALTLANDVAQALDKHYPGTFVGMYAYNEHSPPPTIKAHPRVIISVATSFIRGGFTVDKLLEGWHKQGAMLGIREYYSVNTWDRDLPGAARATRLAYVRDTVPHFHANGARFFSAESSDNWGPNGLGYYLASRILWDVREAKRADAIVDDFFDKAFGPARKPMEKYYGLLDGANRPLLSDDLVGRMYRLLAEARGLAGDPAIERRLDELVLYTRYVELWLDYANAEGAKRQENFEKLIRHAYRMRGTMLIHTKALYRDLDARDKSVSIPKEAAWNVPEKKNAWKDSTPFSKQELEEISARGIAVRKLFDFTPVSFSQELVLAARLNLPEVKPGTMGLYSRGVRVYHTWAPDKGANLALKVTGGRVYQNRGEVKLALFPAADVEGKASDQASAPGDREPHPVTLKSPHPGHHRLEVSDAGAGTEVSWPEGMTMTVASSSEQPASFHGRWTLYFYVPKGTKMIGGYASGVGFLRDGAGNKVHTFDKQPGYFSIPVPSGQDGKLWKFENSAGQRLLMTVPPYLARSGRELLLPAEIVERDAEK